VRIAVVGDHCLDIDYIGEYDGLMSREIERLPVFNCSSVRYSGGGAANIVQLLSGLGAEVYPAGAYDDVEGEILMDKVWQAHEEIWDNEETVDWMIEGQPTPSFIKYYQRSGQHIFRMNKKSEPLKLTIEAQLIENIGQLAVDAIIVADYDETGNGIVTFGILDAIIKRPGLKFGTSRTRPSVFGDFDYVVLSEKESQKCDVEEYGDLDEPQLIITKGADGACMYSDLFYMRHDRPHEIALIDKDKHLTKDIGICGCGDSFLSAFVIKKLEGLDDLECLRWGNAAGRAQARKLYGAHTFTWQEIGMEYTDLYGMNMAERRQRFGKLQIQYTS